MLHLDKIQDQIGYLVLTEDGAVIASGGELENDEHIADLITNLISLADKVDPSAFQMGEGFKRMTVSYNEFAYVICLSNKKMYVVKRRLPHASPEISVS